jgi:heat shock protein HslJ
MGRSRTRGVAAAALLPFLLAACGATKSPAPAPSSDGAPMSMVEMRLQEAGGPAPAPKAVGIVNPVQDPANVTPSSSALTDAGPNTVLGKQWVFTREDGFAGELPGPPTQAGLFLSRGNGRMIGNTSCNAMSAAFDIDAYAGTLKFRNVTNGSAMCSRQASDTEGAVVDALVATDSFRLDGKTLTLSSKGRVVAELVTP